MAPLNVSVGRRVRNERRAQLSRPVDDQAVAINLEPRYVALAIARRRNSTSGCGARRRTCYDATSNSACSGAQLSLFKRFVKAGLICINAPADAWRYVDRLEQ